MMISTPPLSISLSRVDVKHINIRIKDQGYECETKDNIFYIYTHRPNPDDLGQHFFCNAPLAMKLD